MTTTERKFELVCRGLDKISHKTIGPNQFRKFARDTFALPEKAFLSNFLDDKEISSASAEQSEYFLRGVLAGLAIPYMCMEKLAHLLGKDLSVFETDNPTATRH